jgi:hypothetical protein
MSGARIAEFIVTDDLRGRGTDDDPYVRVRQLWTKDGKLVVEWNPYSGHVFVGDGGHELSP